MNSANRLLLAGSVLVLCLLSGCASGMRPMAERRLPPAAMLAPCPKPPRLLQRGIDAAVENHIEAMLMFKDCAARQQALANWITADVGDDR